MNWLQHQRGAKASEDGLKVRIVVDNLREGYIHDIKPEGVLSATSHLNLFKSAPK